MDSEETELGRIAGLGYGLDYGGPIRLGLVVTTKRIIRIGAAVRWTNIMLGVVVWFLVFISLLTFLFTLLREIVVVIGFGMLPIFILLIPMYLGKKIQPKNTPANNSDILREHVVRVVFKKPEIGTQRREFEVNLANGLSFVFWTAGRSKFDEASSTLQRFCNLPPVIPIVEAPQ